MKGKLIKTGNDYILRDLSGEVLGITIGEINGKLSLKNCQAIERGYDLDELAEKATNEYNPCNNDYEQGFKHGFQKALNILGDRRFTEDDMRKFGTFMCKIDRLNFELPDGSLSHGDINVLFNHWKSLQQNEWEVEFEMEYQDMAGKWFSKPTILSELNRPERPKLDASGRITLKRAK